MKVQALTTLLMVAFLAPVAVADEAPMVVFAEPTNVRVRTNDIYSWSSENDTSLVLTTKRRDQYLIEFGRPCFNLKHGPRSNALVTDSGWLDRNSHIRLLDRDRLPSGQLADRSSGDFLMRMNTYSSLCAIKKITSLGKKPRVKRENA